MSAITITADHYRALADDLSDAIIDRDYFNGSVEIDESDFYGILRLTAIIYWKRDTDGAGRPLTELANILPVWWEFRTCDNAGDDVANDFNFNELKKYMV